jgi:hypothetical protein
MSPFEPSKFDIDSSIELVADHWNAQSPSTELFRNAAPGDEMDLSGGLIIVGGTPQTIQAVVDGVIDEYEIQFTPNAVTQNVRGRDASAHVLDTYVNIQFRKGPPVPALEEAGIQATTDIRYGSWTAKSIAQAVVAVAGLTLSWEVRDYIFLETFNAQGRVVDVLKRLVEPWTLVTPFTADVIIQGTLIVIAYRANPDAIAFTPNYTFTARLSRRESITVRLRRLRKYGRVILTGAKVPGDDGAGMSISPNGTPGGFTFASGTQTIEETSEQFDDEENLISRTVTVTQFRTPDRIPLNIVKSTYTKAVGAPLTLTNRETIEVDLEDSIYNDQGPVNQPKTLGKITTVEGVDPADEIFKVVSQEILDYDYDDLDFLKYEGILKKTLDPESNVGALINNTLVTKNYKETGALDVTLTMESFVFDTEEIRWRRIAREESRSAGHRPGGPNRGQSTAGLTAGQAAETVFKNAIVDQTISTDKEALPFSYSNPNLSLADLQFLMALFVKASGLKEYEVTLQGIAIPWLRRGNIIQITELIIEDGVTTYNLIPFKITEVRLNYDESKKESEFMMPVARGFAWQV